MLVGLVLMEGHSVEVLSPTGSYLVRLVAGFPVNNIAFAGRDLEQLCLFGQGGVARVEWDVRGLEML